MSDHALAPGHDTEQPEETMTTYTIVFIALLVLLIATFLAYQVDLGEWNLLIALIIAVIKALMVLMVFMHVRLSAKIVWVFSLASFLWLALMIAGFVNDYWSRPMDGADAHAFISPEAAAMRGG